MTDMLYISFNAMLGYIVAATSEGMKRAESQPTLASDLHHHYIMEIRII